MGAHHFSLITMFIIRFTFPKTVVPPAINLHREEVKEEARWPGLGKENHNRRIWSQVFTRQRDDGKS
ncbi:hypothetical protein E2C01_084432 [Portunus trituberculatus]|uniref:Uncharacterized protein n=1 Tax=Portunus trituberculatus TaxID=210409 RepID=A0A5B7IVA2_PORTR|nr:hypothetical protein [Portunus trituberculatus]